MAVPNHFAVLEEFWQANASKYNFVHQEDCGKFTEAFLIYLINETNETHYAHLKKYGSQTQYNGHAIDVIAFDNRSYPDGTDIMEVDIIGSAESTNAAPTWQVRETTYTEEDLMQPYEVPGGLPDAGSGAFPSYDELGGDQLCSDLIGIPMEADYKEAGQAMNAGSSVWVNRTIYDAMSFTMNKGLEARLAYQLAAAKHRNEWRHELGLPPIVIPRPGRH